MVEETPKDPKEKETPEKNAYVDERVDEFLGEDPSKVEVVEDKEDTPDKPEDKPEAPEDTPEATPEAPEAPEAPKEPETPEEPKVDVTALKEEVTKEVTEGIANRLIGERKPEEDVPPWEKEGRNPKDYNEIANYVADLTQKRITDQQAEVQKQQQEDKAKQVEVQQKSNEEWNTYWNGQLDELRTEDKLPKIANAKDEKDAGKVAERGIFNQMFQHNIGRNSEGKPPITNIHEFFHRYYKNPTDQPPGADAPVSGGKKSVDEGKNKEEYTYEEINSARNFEDLLGT